MRCHGFPVSRVLEKQHRRDWILRVRNDRDHQIDNRDLEKHQPKRSHGLYRRYLPNAMIQPNRLRLLVRNRLSHDGDDKVVRE